MNRNIDNDVTCSSLQNANTSILLRCDLDGGNQQVPAKGEYSNVVTNDFRLNYCMLQRTSYDIGSISVFYQNVRGLRTKIDDLFLAAIDCNYDVIILTETGLNDCINDLQLFGTAFSVFRCDRSPQNSCKSRLGGVLVAVARRYCSNVVHTNHGQNLEQIGVSSVIKGKNLLICAVYIPPDKSNDIHTINDHLASIEEMKSKSSLEVTLLVCGDYNQPHMQWIRGADGICCCTTGNQLPPSSCTLLDGMDFLNLAQTNLVRNRLNRTLDLVYCTFEQELIVSECPVPLLPIDNHHPPLEISVPAVTVCDESNSANVEQMLNYRRINFAALFEHLLTVNWASRFASRIVDSMAEVFTDEICSWLSTNVPHKRAATAPAWSTSRLRELKRVRNACQRRLRHRRTVGHIRDFHSASNAYRQVNAMLYKSYVLRIQSSLRRNPRSFWSFVNSKRKTSSISSNVFLDDASATSSATSCDLFARHFASVFSPIGCSQNEAESAALGVPSDLVDIRTFTVTSEMVVEAAKKLKCSYSPGPDGVPAVVLCRCIGALADPLCCIFNRSFEEEKFPSVWKQSYMFPVFKTGDRRSVKNYRGITSLPAASKLFEIIVSGALLEQTKNYISFDQHGFMPGRSVTTNLLQFTSTCIANLESKAQIDVIYTDLKAAFDKIDHRILLCKLSRLGASGKLISWLRSYLTDRSLRVNIDGCTSNPFSNASGIPQGSNLGPLLFNIFFNDAALLLGNGCRLVYADDLKLYFVVRSIEDCKHLQSLLDVFADWCRRNKLTLSVNKCVVITFHRILKPIIFNYQIDGVTLSRVDEVNDLGVQLDSKLSFDLHRSMIISKASRQLGFIAKIAKDFTDPHCLKALYCALVRPLLETAAVVWSPYQTSWSIRIERIQKRFIRLALKDLPWRNPADLPPYPDRCRLLGLDTLHRRRQAQQAVLIAKILNSEIDTPYLLSALDLRAPQRTLRNDTLLLPRFHRTSFGYNEPVAACLRAFAHVEELFDFNEPSHCFMNKILRSTLI